MKTDKSTPQDFNRELIKANNYHQNGQFHEAFAIYNKLLNKYPENAALNNIIGILQSQIGNYEDSIKYFKNAIKINPDSSRFHYNIGLSYAALNKSNEAIKCLNKAISIDPFDYNAYFNIALELHKTEHIIDSISYYDKAIAIKDDFVEAYSNKASALKSLNRIDESIACFEKVIKIKPDEARLYNNLGVVLQQASNLDRAKNQYEKAISIDPYNSDYYKNLGSVLHKMGKNYDALEMFKKSLSIDQNNYETLYNIGNVFQELLYIDDAILFYEKALDIKQDYAKAHFNMALALLLKGDYKKGFKEYEWRWETDNFPEAKRNYSKELWDGNLSKNSVLLLYAEQGAGDAIQFIRYLPMVKKLVKSVIVEVQTNLTRLITDSNLADIVIKKHEALPDFDIHASILDLPKIFKTNTNNIPQNIPYVKPGSCSDKIRNFCNSLNDKFKIGIIWRGEKKHPNDHNRSIKLEYFKKIASLDNTVIISLQKGINTDEINDFSASIINADHLINDFCDTACIMQKLDLIITVDTSTAHLAGSLGKKTWVLLPYAPDWRWMLVRNDSPWYPKTKLFRQKKSGDWQTVFNTLYNELSEIITKKQSFPTQISNKKALVTLAIGGQYLFNFAKFCKENWHSYAAKHGYDLIVFDKPIDSSDRALKRSFAWQKCLILDDKNLRKYSRVVWIDADIIINYQDSPCICENVPVEKIGAVNCYANPSREIYKLFLKRMYDSWKQLEISYVDNLSPHDFYTDFGLKKGFDDVVQTGVMVLSPLYHRDILKNTYDNYEEKRGAFWNYEMRPLSYEIMKNGLNHWIDHRYNTDWLFEKFFHYPFLIDSLSHKKKDSNIYELLKKCATVTYLNSYFLHFAGISGEMQFVDTKIRSIFDI